MLGWLIGGWTIAALAVLAAFVFARKKEEYKKETKRLYEHIRKLKRAPKRELPISPDEMESRLAKLILSGVEEALAIDGYGPEEIPAIICGYKRFLFLYGTGTGALPPRNTEVDKAWCAHILEMRRYGGDCKLLFGEMLYREST